MKYEQNHGQVLVALDYDPNEKNASGATCGGRFVLTSSAIIASYMMLLGYTDVEECVKAMPTIVENAPNIYDEATGDNVFTPLYKALEDTLSADTNKSRVSLFAAVEDPKESLVEEQNKARERLGLPKLPTSASASLMSARSAPLMSARSAAEPSSVPDWLTASIDEEKTKFLEGLRR